jgi:hypothetical protein
VSPEQVELCNEGKYPIFTVHFRYDPRASTSSYFSSLYARVAPLRARTRRENRRIFLIAASSVEGLLTERRTAAQPWRRELAYMPPQQLLDRGGEAGDPWPLLTLFQTGGLSNPKN